MPFPGVDILPSKIHNVDPLDRGLVGEWQFDHNTGLLLPDYSGYGNSGTITSATWDTSEFGPVLDFSGTPDYVRMLNSTGAKFQFESGDFCIEAFIYRVSNAYQVICGTGLSDFGYAFASYTSDNLLIYTKNVFQTSAANVVGTNNWYHVGFNFYDSDNSGEFFVDGNSVGTVAGLVNPQAFYDLHIGIDPRDQTGQEFDGQVALVRLYERALSAAEFAARHQISRHRAQRVGDVWAIPWVEIPTGAITYTTTAAFQSALQEAVSQSVAYQAALKESPSIAFAYQAVLREVASFTAAFQSAIKESPDVTAAFASVLYEAVSATAAVQAVIKETASNTAAGRAILKETASVTAALRSVLKETAIVTAPLRAVLKETASVTAAFRAQISAAAAVSATAAFLSVLLETAAATAAFRSVFKETASFTAAWQAYITMTIGNTVAARATLKETVEGTAAGRAIIKMTTPVTAAARAILKETAIATAPFRSYIKERIITALQWQAVLKMSATATAAWRARLLSGVAVAADLEAQPRTFSLEAQPRTFTLTAEERSG